MGEIGFLQFHNNKKKKTLPADSEQPFGNLMQKKKKKKNSGGFFAHPQHALCFFSAVSFYQANECGQACFIYLFIHLSVFVILRNVNMPWRWGAEGLSWIPGCTHDGPIIQNRF